MKDQNEDKEYPLDPNIQPIDWKHARPQPRVRPQWEPAELANQLLDEMERAGRLKARK